jgi:hypothetical protein
VFLTEGSATIFGNEFFLVQAACGENRVSTLLENAVVVRETDSSPSMYGADEPRPRKDKKPPI